MKYIQRLFTYIINYSNINKPFELIWITNCMHYNTETNGRCRGLQEKDDKCFCFNWRIGRRKGLHENSFKNMLFISI